MKRHVLPDGGVEEQVTPREARQGRLGVPVLYVLVVGLTLAGIVFAVLFLGSKATDTVPNSETKGRSSIEMVQRAA